MPLSGHSEGTYQENELTRISSGNTRSQSSQLAKPLWIDPGVMCGIDVRELISKQTTTTKAQAGTELPNILSNTSHERKKPPPMVIVRIVGALMILPRT